MAFLPDSEHLNNCYMAEWSGAAMTKDTQTQQQGQKRLLALDGGGIMGVLSLCYLERIEAILKGRSNDPESFRLSDYFDLIGGTSTGAIIASGLATGRPVADLVKLYRELGKKVFKRRFWRVPGVVAKFPATELLQALEGEFGDISLGSEEVRTGLAICAKRFDTGSPWIVHNSPKGKFWDVDESDDHGGNKNIRLSHLVRASAAAPFYFAPQSIDLGNGAKGVFVDGAVSPHGNPALILYLIATLKAYGFEWPQGEDRLQLISVGTASRRPTMPIDKASKMTAATTAIHSLSTMLNDTEFFAQIMLQAMGRVITPWKIDSELGDMAEEQLTKEKQFTYIRYGIRMESEWLDKELGLQMSDDEAAKLFSLDDPRGIAKLFDIGRLAAEKLVDADHLERHFDPVG